MAARGREEIGPFSLVRVFYEDEGNSGDGEEDEPQNTCIRVISSSWLSCDRSECWWPPESVSSDRAGRMAALHKNPDHATWQTLKVQFIQSYRLFTRANKNRKLLEKGEEIEGDETTDLDVPRKKRVPARYVQQKSDTEEPPKKKAARLSRQTSDSDDSAPKIIAPSKLNNLETKLNQVLARRQVQSKLKSTTKEKTKKVVAALKPKAPSETISKATVYQHESFSPPTVGEGSEVGDTVDLSADHDLSETERDFLGSTDPIVDHGDSPVCLVTSKSSFCDHGDTSQTLKTASLQPSSNHENGEGSGEDDSGNSGNFSANESRIHPSSSSLAESKIHVGTSNVSVAKSRTPSIPLSLPVKPSSSKSGKPDSGPRPEVSSGASRISSCSSGRGAESPITPNIRKGIVSNMGDPSGSAVAPSHLLQLYEDNANIKNMLKKVLINQRRILSFVVPEDELTENDCETLPIKDFPLESEEKFDKFEEFLSIKPQKCAAVKYIVSLHRAEWDEAKFARKILRHFISSDLSKIISWEGTENLKIAFCKTNLNNAIRLAVLSVFSKSDLSKGEAALRRWFYTSNQR